MRFLWIFLFLIGCGESSYVFWKKSVTFPKEYNTTYQVRVEVPDYMLAGNFVGVRGGELVLLPYKINSVPSDFFAKYSVYSLQNLDKKDLFTLSDGKVINIKILDYYVDFDNKEVIIYFELNSKPFKVVLPYKGNYKKALKDAYDRLILKVKENYDF
ncbi:MAG: hypothetical protein ABGX23_02655 [Nautiliaceae bacterium]